MARRTSALSLIQFLRAVFEKKAKNQKKMRKKRQIYPIGAMSQTPRGYYGHKFGIHGCPIVIRRYMPSFIKILRAVFEKFEVFQKVGIGVGVKEIIVFNNSVKKQ